MLPPSHLVRRISLLALLSFAPIFLTAAPDTTLTMAGLKAPVEILKDEWGVSHIYARNQHDLFFAQGFNAARDRLFQFELWRRRATGTLAEIQGEKAIAHDEGARLLRFRDDMSTELNHYHDDGNEIVHAFVDGINAYIEFAMETPETLPIEFRKLGITPGKWTPEVVVSRHNALTGGISYEVMLAETITALGAELTGKVLPFEREPNLIVKPGIDLAVIDGDVMTKYRASRTQPPFTDAPMPVADLYSPLTRTESLGSNNWIISGEHTVSGKPLLANDPHRSIQIPSLRYMVHLHAPATDGNLAWNVIGAGEPALPGISIGHNEHGAWGLTIFRIDQEDLYVYETNPDNPDQYRYLGKWRDMEIEETVINVKDAAPVTKRLRYTIHGPVIHEDTPRHIAFGLRAAWLEPGAAPYLASLRMDQAVSWPSFRAACTYSGLPGENMVWADRYGDIGWQSVGYTPVRFGWDGRLPIPGDGTYEWQGMVPIDAMPHLSNPASGWYGTANENNVPDHYPNIFADFYSDPARAERLREVLSGVSEHGIDDSRALQYDNKSMTAAVLTPILTGLKKPRSLRKLSDILAQWDHRMDRDSSAAAIYDKWELAMLEKVNERILPGQNSLVTRVKLRAWVSAPPEYVFGDQPIKNRNKMMIDSLAEANAQLIDLLGDKPNSWQYGQIHVADIQHPLSIGAETRSEYDVGPLPRGGASNTLNANHGNTRQIAGGSFRMIVDTADWDKTIATNTPGQSGDPDSPFYRNLFKNWNEGEYFPLYFSREKVESVVAHRTLLRAGD